jgi:hypothetical protein
MRGYASFGRDANEGFPSSPLGEKMPEGQMRGLRGWGAPSSPRYARHFSPLGRRGSKTLSPSTRYKPNAGQTAGGAA